MPGGSPLASLLRAREPDIHYELLARLDVASEPPVATSQPLGEAERTAGLAVDFAFTAIEFGGERIGPSARKLSEQVMGRIGSVPQLSSTIQRFIAVFGVLNEIAVEEAERQGSTAGELEAAVRFLFSGLETAVDTLVEEYNRRTPLQRAGEKDRNRSEAVGKLLDRGRSMPHDPEGYGLDAWHVGVSASHGATAAHIGAVATDLSRISLCVQRQDRLWAWLGGSRAFRSHELDRLAEALAAEPETIVGLGQPAQGPRGWRDTQEQAGIALTVALQQRKPFVHYREVALSASAHSDRLLTEHLRATYLRPLEGGRDSGVAVIRTLQVYCRSKESATSTAAILSVSRRTVTNRLRRAEEILGGAIHTMRPELDVALQIYGGEPVERAKRN